MSKTKVVAGAEPESSTWPGRLTKWLEPQLDLLSPSAIKLEEFRDDGSLVIRAELPGIDPDKDLEVSVAHGMLRIFAQRRQASEAEEKDGYRSEFRYGSFTRSMHLPPGATDDDVKAAYVDGILEVRVPLDTQKASSRKVAVERMRHVTNDPGLAARPARRIRA